MGIVNPNYFDDGGLREQDSISVERFLHRRDRTQLSGRGTPFFSGREAEVRVFRDTLNALAAGEWGNATLVIEGPPGAGKTALMAQFQEEMCSLPQIPDGERRWLAPCLDGAEALCPAEVMMAVDEAIVNRLARDWRKAASASERTRLWSRIADLGQNDVRVRDVRTFIKGLTDRGVSAMGFSLGAKNGRAPTSMREVQALRGREWGKWQIVLMIDEAQAITKSAPGASPSTLSSLHQGVLNMPLTFCAFGLPGTWDALGNVGISRGSAGRDIALGGLADSEAEAAVKRCFKRFQVERAEAWESAILARSANWPQHLAGYLHAAVSVLFDDKGTPGAPVDAHRESLDEALRRGDAIRTQYYLRRTNALRASNRRHPHYARQLIPAFRAAQGRLDVESAMGLLAGEPLCLDNDRVDRFMDDAEHSGLFIIDADGLLHMPIPSFGAHLLNESLPPATKASAEP